MSSAGQAVGGVVGAVAGFFIGGPKGALYGAQLGMMAGGLIDPPKGPEIVGPRLDDLKVQTSTYGAPIPRLYGTIATAGNIFWLENNSLKEVAKKKKSGGKGGPSTTTTTFSYYATFALGLCDCSGGSPIAGVRRIWCGADLIYDAGASDVQSIIASNGQSAKFTLHTGALDQMPDDRMQSTLGVANTPAYRGLAYLVFNDFPLEKYSNSLMAAQFKVEVVTSATVSSLVRTTTVADTGKRFGSYWSGEGIGRPYIADHKNGVLSVSTVGGTVDYLFDTNGKFLSIEKSKKPPLSFSSNQLYSCGFIGTDQLIFNGISLSPVLILANKIISGSLPQTHKIMTVSIANDESEIFVITAAPGQSSAAAYIRDWFIIDKNGAILRSGVTEFSWSLSGNYIARGQTFNNYSAISFDKSSMRLGLIYGAGEGTVRIWRIDPDNVVRQEYLISLAQGLSSYRFTYPTVYLDKGVLFAFSESSFNVFTSGLMQVSPDTLSSILRKECLLSRLVINADIDTSSITQNIRGYRVSNVAAIRGAIEPLQAAYPFDVVQRGYQVVFVARGGASVATIDSADLDARSSSDSAGVSIVNTREMDSILPRRVVANYLDVQREYDTGTQSDERLNTDSVNTRTIELALVLDATEALGIVQTLLYLYWLERYSINFTLPATYNHLEPADVLTINGVDATYILRLTEATYTQDNRIECAAKYHSAAIYTRTAIGEEGQSSGGVISISGANNCQLLDVPLLLDALDAPGFPVAMAGYLSGWPGGFIFRSDDDGQTWDDMQAIGAPGASIGYAKNTISAPTSMVMIDKSSALNAVMINATLSSVTEDALLNGVNYFAYGINGRWEIIAAQNCTLQADGSYILTDILRGQQGTEWAAGLHAINDSIIKLDSDLVFMSVSINSIGQGKIYRGVTIGSTIESASDIPFTYSGVNLECLSPCYLNGNRNAANDWSLTWIRRTRVGGALRDYVDASLGEASEAYEVEIYSSNTYATLKRTITGLTTPAAAYTSAQQVTDFGSNQSTLYIKIYQLSANVGRGYPLITSITR